VHRSDLLGPLAGRQFRRLWLAATTSAIGSAFVPVAMAFAVLDIGGSATSLGIVLLVGTRPDWPPIRSLACGRTGSRAGT
jgi:hypothetical protein